MNETGRSEDTALDKQTRPHMDVSIRAKQFLPFDALNGFREALAEKEQCPVFKKDLSDDQKEWLDRILRQIRKTDMIEVEYFHSGEYLHISGTVSQIDKQKKVLKIGATEIPFENISGLEYDL